MLPALVIKTALSSDDAALIAASNAAARPFNLSESVAGTQRTRHVGPEHLERSVSLRSVGQSDPQLPLLASALRAECPRGARTASVQE